MTSSIRDETHTFIPSKEFGQYWKQELAGSKLNGWYGWMTGALQPEEGSNVMINMWSVIVWIHKSGACHRRKRQVAHKPDRRE